MAAIAFPDSPSPGDTFVSDGILYTFDGVKWTAAAAPIGPTGPTGPGGGGGTGAGTSGYSGVSGYSGQSGYSGVSGYSGQSGYSGVSGYSGQSGYSGTSGFGATGPTGPGGGGGSAAWTVKTGNYTAASGDRIIADSSGGTFTITLPATPSAGNSVQITDGYDFTITPVLVANNGSTIEGINDSVNLDYGNVTYEFIYNGTTWQLTVTTGARGPTGVPGSATNTGATGPVGAGYWTQTGSDIYYTSGNVGIGTTGPLVPLHVVGNALVNGEISVTTSVETETAPTISAGTLTLDLNTSNIFDVNLNADISTLTLTNVNATSGKSVSFVLIFTADGTARSVTWPTSFRWPNGTAPTITSTNLKRDIFTFFTTDNGTSWNSFISGQNL